ncbi:MAG: polysaccharide deacetylase family protein [Gammaproteobacteria bacterium]
MSSLTVTLDLEDHTQGSDPARRYRDNARRILEHLAARGTSATIFIVGDVIEECRDIIRAGVAAGHEFGLHSATHTPLTRQAAPALAPALADATQRLADLSGQPVRGFRAPVFSLTPATVWITDLLGELGYRYSSSVLPAPHPLFGFPGAPTGSFRWPNGLVELPVPLARIGPATVPFLGGIYLRYLPLALIRRCRATLAPDVLPWTYLHPYDIDAAEGYFRFPEAGALMSVLLWRRRGSTLARLDALLEAAGGGTSPTLSGAVEALDVDALPSFDCAH